MTWTTFKPSLNLLLAEALNLTPSQFSLAFEADELKVYTQRKKGSWLVWCQVSCTEKEPRKEKQACAEYWLEEKEEEAV